MDILDLIWEIRRGVYGVFSFKDLPWREIFMMEYEIEQKLFKNIEEKDMVHTNFLRSDLVEVHRAAATAITKTVIKAHEEKRLYYGVRLPGYSSETDSD